MLPCLPQDTVTQAAAGLGFRQSCPSVAMSATRHRQQQALASGKAAASVLRCLPQDTVTQAAAGLGYKQSCLSVAMSATRHSDTGSGRFRLREKPLSQYHHACLMAASVSSCLPHGTWRGQASSNLLFRQCHRVYHKDTTTQRGVGLGLRGWTSPCL